MLTREYPQLTREAILNGWNANHWNDLKVICPDGAEAILSPCSSVPEITGLQDLDYIVVTCGDIPYLGDDDLDQVIHQLNRHAEIVAELNAEKARLRSFFEKHIQPGNFDDDTWGAYSDWHKDVYGFRPHGIVCGVYVYNPRA